MSFDTLKKEVESLADGERRELLAFMVAIEDRGRQDYPGLLARRIDGQAPEHWVAAGKSHALCDRSPTS